MNLLKGMVFVKTVKQVVLSLSVRVGDRDMSECICQISRVHTLHSQVSACLCFTMITEYIMKTRGYWISSSLTFCLDFTYMMTQFMQHEQRGREIAKKYIFIHKMSSIYLYPILNPQCGTQNKLWHYYRTLASSERGMLNHKQRPLLNSRLNWKLNNRAAAARLRVSLGIVLQWWRKPYSW